MAAVTAIVISIDSRAGDQLVRFASRNVAGQEGLALQLRENASLITRSAWDLSYVYGPLMTFTAVALVLLIFMLKMK